MLFENKQKDTVSQDYEHEEPQDYESEEPDVPAPPVEPKVSAAPVTDQPVTDQPVYKEPLATTILANAVVHLEAVMESMSKRVDPVGPVDPVGAVDRADPAVVPKAPAEKKRKADKKPAAVQEMDKKPAAVQEMGMEFDPDCDSDGDSSHRSQRKRHATNRLGFGSQMNGKGLKPPPTLPLGET